MSVNKSCDITGNVADFLIDDQELILSYFRTYFHNIFDFGLLAQKNRQKVLLHPFTRKVLQIIQALPL